MDIYASARKHGVSEIDIAHAVQHAVKPMTDGKSFGRSTAGVDLTNEVLDQMADEAEAGLDITKLRRRPGRPAMGSGPAESLPVRLDPELRKALDDRAATEQTTASDVIREALRRYLKAG